ncbi:PrsW family intramembrane metalloprotease [Mariniluteicoccus flavus]
MQHAATNTPDLQDSSLRRALSRSNLPLSPKPGRSWPERMLRSKWTWLTLALLLVEALCLWLMYRQVVPDQKVPGGTLIGLGTEAIVPAAKYAVISLIPLTILFVWADRFRPMRFWIWLVTLGWGGCISTYLSMLLNTEAARHLAIQGNGDPATAARAAVFVAPFVEESTKATILFFLAILLRYRWVSRLSGIALAGLSGAAFAFTENILYYGRVYRAAAQTTGAGDPAEMMHELFIRRGVLTFFAHPLFTCLTGIGLAIAMRARSKTVRVLAPLVGFLAAALLHMLFNGMASSGMPEQMLLVPLILVAYPMAIALAVHTVRQVFTEKRLIAARLTDYHRMGWLKESDPENVSRISTRIRVLWQALWAGRIISTWTMQRTLTELAYLRDSMARGLVDQAGWVHEKQLLFRARDLRGRAIVEPWPKTRYPWQRDPRPVEDWAPPAYPGPAGLGGTYPAPLGSGAPGQQARTTAVNPAWGPPGS